MRSPFWPLVVLILLPGTSRAAHPLIVDDAATLDPGRAELELSYGLIDVAPGRLHSGSAAGRLGMTRWLDGGLAVAWFDAGTGGSATESVLDLKLAPGRAEGWRPRPFLRGDFALLTGATQAELSFATLSAGLTWEFGRSVVSTELGWVEPLDSDLLESPWWRAATGAYVPLAGPATLAAEWRHVDVENERMDFGVLGVLWPLGPGNLSAGLEFGLRETQTGDWAVLGGWTTEFGL